MPRAADQYPLFDVGRSFPNGLVYRPNFLTAEEEAELIGFIEDLPLEAPYYDGYQAKRRVLHFGWTYDARTERLIPGAPLPPFLAPLARRIAKWLDVPAKTIVEALITEYRPGAAIGWHRDNEPFDRIVGVSLAGWCTLRLRPYGGARTELLSLPLEPRSAYIMQKDSRWKHQHSVAATKTLRYSITFRTLPA